MKSKKKMKRKRIKKGMLLAELYRLFMVRRLMTGLFLVAMIAVISVSDLISIDSINWPVELKQSICDQLQMTLIFDRYKSLYVIAASICTVTTFPSDIKNHVLPYYSCKCDHLYRLIHHSWYGNEAKGYYRIVGTRKKIVSCRKRKNKNRRKQQ